MTVATLTERRREDIRRLCKERGIAVQPAGKAAFRLTGEGVDVVVADLAHVNPSDIERTRKPWARGSPCS